MSWDRRFNEPIALPDGSKLTTLRDAGVHILKLPKSEHDSKELQEAADFLIEAAEHDGAVMFAHIGVLRVLSRPVDEPSPKDPVKLIECTMREVQQLKKHHVDPSSRSLIASETLQSAITDAVKKAEPACEAFVGVIVEPTTPQSRFDANWALRGVKFGRADREKANKAVTTIVERMQREFCLSDD
jgi:hypothetical protein